MACRSGSSDTGSPQETADVRESAGHGAKSAAARERAILALLSEKSISKAAARCGTSEKTLRRWMADDEEFKIALVEARRVRFEAGMGRLQALTVDAVDALAALLRPNTPPTVRLGAARTVVELGLHQRDADSIMRRLGEIEACQRQQSAARRS